MSRWLCAAALIALAAPLHADGPGSRLRAGPAAPQPPLNGAAERDAQRCDAMEGDAKERCRRALGSALRAGERPPHESRGPEAVGGTSGAGAGATSGTAGGGSFGASAPR